MGFYRGPNIVTDGLVFVMDPASERSYPGSGTTVDSVVGSHVGSLSNGVGFTTDNAGGFVFDGVDDGIGFPYDSIFQMDTNSTIEIIFKCDVALTNSTDLRRTLFSNAASNSFGLEIGSFSNCNINSTVGNRFLMHRQGNCFSAVSLADAWAPGDICCFTYTRNASRVEKMYVNGLEITLQQGNGYTFASGGTNASTFGIRQGLSGGQRFDGNIYRTSFYSKALSAAEVAQNFNAQKSRFGL